MKLCISMETAACRMPAAPRAVIEAKAPHAVTAAHDAMSQQGLMAIRFDIGVDLECPRENTSEKEQWRRPES